MLKYLEKYRNFELCQEISKKIKKISKKPVKLMEVCGTHTMSIFRHGIRGLLPEHISLISGPGCPVCVTSQEDIDDFIYISKQENIIITTFGDLIRVPGTNSSLQKEKAKGQDIRIIYSVFDALEIAQKNPEKKIVFLGVGFETTIPTIAAAILSAQDLKINNFFVLCSHKLLPPALFALSNLSKSMNAKIIDGFILPGHVSVIIGTKGYRIF